MEYKFDNLVYCSCLGANYTLSLKGVVASAGDSIDLPLKEHHTGLFFSLSARLNWDAFAVVANRLQELTFSVTANLSDRVKRIAGRITAAGLRFFRSNQRRGRRVAPMVPMALRL